MAQDNIIRFPTQPRESERLRLYRDEPCTVLFLSWLQANQDAKTARKAVK
jgi:hypothetical protein